MNVALGQSVDVQLNTHEEPYKQPPKVYKPFGGGGQRLGSPTPGSPSRSSAVPAPGPSSLATSSSNAAPSTPEVAIDLAVPTISLRIQLADGTRLPARFNITHTIGDIYDFIDRASPTTGGREWVVATTFPNKEHTDKSLVLGDMAEFKRGGTAVQKWA
jgi:UBX domain-containing protein 1